MMKASAMAEFKEKFQQILAVMQIIRDGQEEMKNRIEKTYITVNS